MIQRQVTEIEKELELAKARDAATSFANSIMEANSARESAEQNLRIARDRVVEETARVEDLGRASAHHFQPLERKVALQQELANAKANLSKLSGELRDAEAKLDRVRGEAGTVLRKVAEHPVTRAFVTAQEQIVRAAVEKARTIWSVPALQIGGVIHELEILARNEVSLRQEFVSRFREVGLPLPPMRLTNFAAAVAPPFLDQIQSARAFTSCEIGKLNVAANN
jgi:hypothetical protein